jgi:hypothetical protein
MADDMVASPDARLVSMWDEHANALLKEWRQRVAAASEAHYDLASGLRRKNLWLGVPVVVLSSVVGTSMFATLAKPEQPLTTYKWIIGVTSLSAAVLSALQTFLRFGERAEKHVVAADWYAAVRRDIDQLLALTAEERGRPKECFDRIRKEMSKIGQQSPEIGDRMWGVVAARYGLQTPGMPTAARSAPY